MKIYCIGLGPGELSQLTEKAVDAINDSDTVIGYRVYTDLIKELTAHKDVITTPMTKEVDRCRLAVETALQNKKVAVVSSGDAGVYGMASLIYEITAEHKNGCDIDIEVVAGVTAATSAAAILGAPLTNDFAVISLSDLLTDWREIETRLTAASAANFVICLYNPASKNRVDHLSRACDIILKSFPETTPCGYVKNIARDGEEKKIVTLKELKDAKLDMFTTVIIGNRYTKILNGKLITPRGYKTV